MAGCCPRLIPQNACSTRRLLALLGAFLICFCVDGCVLNIGMMISYWSNYFDMDNFALSWVGSIQMFGSYCLSPLAGTLIGRFGVIRVSITGAIIASAGHLITGLIGNRLSLYICFGLVGGIGYGLLYMTAIITVTTGFNELTPLAMGIMACGSGIGASVHSIIYPRIESVLTWRGLSIITAGILLQTCVFGCLMGLIMPSKAPTPSTQQNPASPPLPPINTQPNATLSFNSADSHNLGFLGSGLLQLPEIMGTGNILASQADIKEAILSPKMQHMMGSLGSFTYLVEIEKLVQGNGLFGKGKPLRKNAGFILYLTGVFVQASGSFSTLVLLFDMLLSDGLDATTSSSIVALTGICNACARLFFGTIATIPSVSKTWLLGSLMIGGGGINLGMCFVHALPYFYMYACVCGLCLGEPLIKIMVLLGTSNLNCYLNYLSRYKSKHFIG